MRDAIWFWPKVPELPPPGRFVLICVRTGSPRAEARSQVRTVLRQILAAWSQLSPEQLPLKETPRGPVWESRLQRDLLATSKQSDTQSPLTPALSPRERGHLSASRVDSPCGQRFPAWSTVLPLPEGEGWGEGKRCGQLITEGFDLSLSYEEGEAWIALSRGGLIGVDVMRLQPVPEAEAIAQTYFGPADRSAFRQSTDPVRDFALAWTQLEARCKCLKQGLTEWSEPSATRVQGCSTESVIIEDRLALSVATAPQDFLCRRNA